MDYTLNLQAAASFLSAAAGAAAGGDPIAAAEDGASFSDVLAQASGAAETGDAAQTEGTSRTEDTAQAADNAEGTAKTEDGEDTGMVNVPRTSLSDILGIIGNSGNGIQSGLKLLFNTMMNAIMGDSSKDKKTDLFSVLSGGSLFGDDDEYGFLMGAELMDRMGTAMSLELAGGTDPDDVIGELDRLLNGLFGEEDDDETDENTAADILAAMLAPEVQRESDLTYPEDKTKAIEAASELFKTPKEVIAEETPEKVPEMETLFEEFSAEFRFKPAEKEDTGIDIRGLMGVNRAAFKVNDAEEQVRTIGGDAGIQAELASAAVQNNAPAENTPEVKPSEFDEFTARSVENQITERISEKLFDMKGDNDTEEMVMVLKPENLGHVAVKLIKENGALTVMLSAQYAEVGKLMADRAAALSDSLTSRNVEVKNVEVVDPSSAAEQMGLNFTNQGFSFGRGQEYSSEDEKNSYAGIDGIDGIEETEPEIEVIREARLWQTA